MITYPNLYHLKYFVDAVALSSISGAAQKNSVTHPAISRAISSLEKHLGIALLEHQKKSFKLTKKGYQVAEQAQILLLAASDFRNLNQTSQKSESVVLKIGISRTLANSYLSAFLQKLKDEFPALTAQVRFGTTNEIIEATASGSIDLGLTIGAQNLATLRQTVITRGKFLLVQSNLLAKVDNGIDSKSFIITEPRMETEKLKSGYKKQFGQALPVLFEISSWESISQLVQKGHGIGLLPDISIKKWKKGSFQILKQTWFECSYEVYIHSSKARSQDTFLEDARNYILEVI
ncbi:MAG: LysR family transcriptional regulator [Bdellovibrionota bacterium]